MIGSTSDLAVRRYLLSAEVGWRRYVGGRLVGLNGAAVDRRQHRGKWRGSNS